jgi:hypothetical protein
MECKRDSVLKGKFSDYGILRFYSWASFPEKLTVPEDSNEFRDFYRT